MYHIEPIKRFICQKVLPVTYDNSLSYYEVLCKFVHTINDVIANMNGLVADYQALYDFVINYFDNLDISEELDKKLEELLESEEFALYLTGIIGFVTPTMYGAKGDGETNDSEAFEDCFASGYDVKIFAGDYKIPDAIVSVDHQNVQCDENAKLYTENPIYLYTGRWQGGKVYADTTTAFSLASGDNEMDGVTINLTVDGDIETLKKNGVSCTDGTGVIKNCHINSDGTGYMGIWADAHDGTNNHYVLQIHNNYIHGFYRNGIFTSAKACDIAYNILDYNHLSTNPGGGQIDIVGKATQGYTTVRNNIIQNGASEATSGIELELSGNAEIYSNVIDVSTTMLYGVVLQHASHANVHDNTIIGGTAIASLGTDEYVNILTTHNNWLYGCTYNFYNGNQTSIISLDESRYAGNLITNVASHRPIMDVNNGYMWTGQLEENTGCNFYVKGVHNLKFIVQRTEPVEGQPSVYMTDVLVDDDNGFVVTSSQSSDFTFADHILTYGNNTLGQTVNVKVMTVN